MMTHRISIWLISLLLVALSDVQAQNRAPIVIFPPIAGGGTVAPVTCQVVFANLPASPSLGDLCTVLDALDRETCTAGGGAGTPALCQWSGSEWLSFNADPGEVILKAGTFAEGDACSIQDRGLDTSVLPQQWYLPVSCTPGAEVWLCTTCEVPVPTLQQTKNIDSVVSNANDEGSSVELGDAIGNKCRFFGLNIVCRDAVGNLTSWALTVPTGGTFTVKDVLANPLWRITSAGESSGTSRTQHINLFDNFFGGSTEAGEVGNLGWVFTGTGVTGSVQNSEATEYGIFRLSTGITINTIGRLHLGNGATTLLFDPAALFDFTFKFRLQSVTLEEFRVGLLSDFSGAPPAEGIYLEFDVASAVTTTEWVCVTNDLGPVTATDTNVTVVADTWYTLRLVRTTTGVQFYLNGVLVCTHLNAEDIPTGFQNIGFQLETTSAADRTFDVGRFEGFIPGPAN
jgi:hypothetical protein